MRLIDLNTVLEEIEDTVTSVSVCGTVEAARSAHATKDRILSRIKELPTIEAVPLDKLCEWLPNAVQSCPANPEGHNEKCEHMKCEECWKEAICNWMEEEKDGTDNP